eukprot:CAMPEP_0179003590 /NCGR_PEP_ID=MMETSP0795-20121207/12789_1 /TAXON_ID=88552 /ORGANISM="Amoebophrya sp., Strain Ameob2" /LENGTH=627 /DNA_ID=CAMNT_0020697669 /DNA_START=65 /DNA_END=1945 /DNA_ORIENTATION=-
MEVVLQPAFPSREDNLNVFSEDEEDDNFIQDDDGSSSDDDIYRNLDPPLQTVAQVETKSRSSGDGQHGTAAAAAVHLNTRQSAATSTRTSSSASRRVGSRALSASPQKARRARETAASRVLTLTAGVFAVAQGEGQDGDGPRHRQGVQQVQAAAGRDGDDVGVGREVSRSIGASSVHVHPGIGTTDVDHEGGVQGITSNVAGPNASDGGGAASSASSASSAAHTTTTRPQTASAIIPGYPRLGSFPEYVGSNPKRYATLKKQFEQRFAEALEQSKTLYRTMMPADTTRGSGGGGNFNKTAPSGAVGAASGGARTAARPSTSGAATSSSTGGKNFGGANQPSAAAGNAVIAEPRAVAGAASKGRPSSSSSSSSSYAGQPALVTVHTPSSGSRANVVSTFSTRRMNNNAMRRTRPLSAVTRLQHRREELEQEVDATAEIMLSRGGNAALQQAVARKVPLPDAVLDGLQEQDEMAQAAEVDEQADGISSSASTNLQLHSRTTTSGNKARKKRPESAYYKSDQEQGRGQQNQDQERPASNYKNFVVVIDEGPLAMYEHKVRRPANNRPHRSLSARARPRSQATTSPRCGAAAGDHVDTTSSATPSPMDGPGANTVSDATKPGALAGFKRNP